MKKSRILKHRLKPYIKNGFKKKTFDDTEIEEFIFHQKKKPYFNIDINIDINKTLVSNKLSFGK